MSKIAIIAALADDGAIGLKNKLPWHLPADLKKFKELTTGHAVIMGKRTFESLPNGPLPNRKNVVLTSMLSEGVVEGYFEADSLEDAFEICSGQDIVYIIGGAAVYKQCFEYADELFLTYIHSNFNADTYFPEINMSDWKEINREDFEADAKNQYPYSFVKYIKA